VNLQNMAPNAKRSMLLTLVFGGIAAVLYFVAVESTETSLLKARQDLEGLSQKHRLMMTNINRADQVKKQLEDHELRLDEYRKALIRPLLNSTAMRAKSFVDALAAGCGLAGMEYEALAPMPLPSNPRAMPLKKYSRCPIRIKCVGSYQSAVSFVRCVERQFPLVALESMSVTTRQENDVQQVEIVLEWPMVREEAAK
jgi:Tfp pilus assembly protein PilO